MVRAPVAEASYDGHDQERTSLREGVACMLSRAGLKAGWMGIWMNKSRARNAVYMTNYTIRTHRTKWYDLYQPQR